MIEREVDVTTSDGVMKTFIYHPEHDGPHPVVLYLMDAPSIRPVLKDMANRLASAGYYVMLPYLFYRGGPFRAFGMSDEDMHARQGPAVGGRGDAHLHGEAGQPRRGRTDEHVRAEDGRPVGPHGGEAGARQAPAQRSGSTFGYGHEHCAGLCIHEGVQHPRALTGRRRAERGHCGHRGRTPRAEPSRGQDHVAAPPHRQQCAWRV